MAEEPKAAEVPEPSPETKETSEVKADVVEEVKETAEAGREMTIKGYVKGFEMDLWLLSKVFQSDTTLVFLTMP